MIEQKNIPISLPFLGEEEWLAVKEPLESGWVTQGPKVREFENLFAELHDVKHAFAVTSCTTALHLSLAALDIGPGDEVIVPSFTWVATPNAVLYCGATPVFADININTFNLDPEDIAARITKKTKAIIPVHLFGLCADMDAIKEAAPGIPLVEDAACAAGSAYKGTPAGGLGDLGCFSFHPRKSITTGEGGMVTTNNDELAPKVEMLRNHGASISDEQRHHGPKPYILPDFNVLGFNYRMTDIQGAIGVVQIKKLRQYIDERNERAKYYENELKDLDWLITPKATEGYDHGWQSYALFINEEIAPLKRNELMEILQEKGISTRPGTHASHMLGYYKEKYSIKPEDYPESLKANDQSMSIPLHNKMDPEDFEYIVSALKSF